MPKTKKLKTKASVLRAVAKYYEKNKEKIRQQYQENKEKKREQYQEKIKEKIMCEFCNKEYPVLTFKVHEKSKRHQKKVDAAEE